MKGKYKRKLIWCFNCDAELVEPGAKCSYCGAKMKASKVKKPNQHQILNGI